MVRPHIWLKHAFVALGFGWAQLSCTCGPVPSRSAEGQANAAKEQAAPPMPAAQLASHDEHTGPIAEPAHELATSPEPRVFPSDLVLFTPSEMPLPGDRSLRVSHAGPAQSHAIIYLHGMCGNSKGADPWSDLATEYGSLIVVRADEPCGDRPGYKWPKDLSLIQARIDAALAAVNKARGGFLDLEHPTLIGYSQGAYRAEQLARAYPERYTRAMLGGPPTPPSYEALKSLSSVAVLGGELEDRAHMEIGTADLIARGMRAKFFLLPKVHHGSYGPHGKEVVGQALNFIFQAAGPQEAPP